MPPTARAAMPLLLLLACGAAMAAEPTRPPPPPGARPEEGRMKIRIRFDGGALTATLEVSEAARDFLALLPLTLTLTDYHATEKIADLPRKLSTTGAPSGVDPEVGDLAYYAPWGNLALFYRDFGYSPGLVRLGRIEGGVERLAGPGPLRVTFERAGP